MWASSKPTEYLVFLAKYSVDLGSSWRAGRSLVHKAVEDDRFWCCVPPVDNRCFVRRINHV